MKQLKRIGVVFIFLMLVACTANMGNIPFENWNTYQKANFFMKAWSMELDTYNSLNAMENKSPDLVTVLKAKYQVLERSRIPIRTYVKIVKAGNIPDATMEQEIINWIRQLQQELVYGG